AHHRSAGYARHDPQGRLQSHEPYKAFRARNAASADTTGLSALSSAVSTSRWVKPSATTTSKPPGTLPKVGKAVFGIVETSRGGEPAQLRAVPAPVRWRRVGRAVCGVGGRSRGVEPSQLGAVQVPMLFANGMKMPGTVARPFVPHTPMTGTLMFPDCVRFSIARRPPPIDSADESRFTDCEHCASVVQLAPTVATTTH